MKNRTIRKVRLIRGGLNGRMTYHRYLLPNLFTVGNLFCGFLAVVHAAAGRYDRGVIAVLAAIVLDGLDGRMARRFNATSRFGVEFDSLADLVSFGIAPAMLVYHWGLKPTADEFGVFVSFMFALAGAVRLARFNLTSESIKNFQGLPTPAAAAVAVGLVYASPEWGGRITTVALCSMLLIGLAVLQVSTIAYPSIKKVPLYRLRFFGTLVVGGLLALIWYQSRIGIVALAAAYALSGPIYYLRCQLRQSKRNSVAVDFEHNDTTERVGGKKGSEA